MKAEVLQTDVTLLHPPHPTLFTVAKPQSASALSQYEDWLRAQSQFDYVYPLSGFSIGRSRSPWKPWPTWSTWTQGIWQALGLCLSLFFFFFWRTWEPCWNSATHLLRSLCSALASSRYDRMSCIFTFPKSAGIRKCWLSIKTEESWVYCAAATPKHSMLKSCVSLIHTLQMLQCLAEFSSDIFQILEDPFNAKLQTLLQCECMFIHWNALSTSNELSLCASTATWAKQSRGGSRDTREVKVIYQSSTERCYESESEHFK